MLHFKFHLLKIIVCLVVLNCLVQKTDAFFCFKFFCDNYPFLQGYCCNVNTDCCTSANLGDNRNCIQTSVANN
ncbi:hypothetical protein CDAR_447841 [Caerostris darwini]|uniref:Uncharacterized protein n=1 Tax=Caerostris darwini TaxID=1538125 RepID=A0AAV4PQC9_9ARAC|nr:hypothetical protein CDAR_447841 [Caerostris darwini]